MLTAGCNSWEIVCDNGRCIDMSDQCDGTNHCGDFSDEIACREFIYLNTLCKNYFSVISST